MACFFRPLDISWEKLKSHVDYRKCVKMTSMFSKTVQTFLSQLNKNPALLRRDAGGLTDIKKRLHSQGDVNSQGTGNQVTDQETCFAATLEECGFKYSSAAVPPSDAGLYYIYQVNGTQRSIDFRAYDWIDGIKRGIMNFDLKHTKTDTFFLNDGWFHENIVYVISWMRKVSPEARPQGKTSAHRKKKVVEAATFIALGQDIPTEEEITLYEELCAIKKKYNTDYNGAGSFRCYLRFANTYKCDRFTPEFTEECLTKTAQFVKGL
jgi:hypothetical protein